MRHPRPVSLILAAVALTLVILPIGASTKAEKGETKDPRDDQIYPTVEITGMTWFARNLNFKTAESFCYDDKPENCDQYGRLYRWEAALSACPPGWHLSTELEWQALERYLGIPDEEIENRQTNRGTDEGARLKKGGDAGFDAQYGGWRRSEDGGYEALGKNAALWMSTEQNLERAWHRDIDTGDDQIWRSRVIKPYGLSVRCVADRYVEDGANF